MVLVSPGFSMLFDLESLQNVRIPVLLIGLESDGLNKPEQQALFFRRNMGKEAKYLSMPEGDCPAMQALCPPDINRDLSDLCNTVSPSQRAEIHKRLTGMVIPFFLRAME
jgi:predicted dienelactone hydrolase